LAIGLLEHFFRSHPDMHIKCILADALYGSADFAATIYPTRAQ